MITDLKNIAPLVKNQFPDFYREEGDNFLQFISAYYEWMDEQGPIKKSRNLIETSDIDSVSEEYIDFFLSKYMNGIPKSVLSDKALLEKHILSVYRSKGSIEGLKLLFRLLYNIEIQVFIPQDDVLVLSGGKWSRKEYVEVEERELNHTYDNKLVRGTTSGARAYVLSISTINNDYGFAHIFYLTDIIPGPSGSSFVPGEYLMYDGLDIRQATLIRGSVVGAVVTSSDENHAAGDILFTESTSGSELQFEVKTIVDPESAIGYINFKIINGGYGYALDTPVTVVRKFASTGTGASFKVGSLSNTSIFTYNTNLIDPEANTIIAPANTQFNANSAVTGGESTGLSTDANSTITVANANTFQYGRSVVYTALAGNTAITGLANNTLYYVQHSNDTVVALSTTIGGSRITLTPVQVSGVEANGHYLQANTQFSANLNVGTIDSVLGNCLADTTLEIGTIKSLSAVTSGDHNYNGSVQPTVFEKRIWGYNIIDSAGNLWGNNAVISGELASGNGVIAQVALLSSGYTFNTPNEELLFINKANNQSTVVLSMIVDGVAKEEGGWLDSSGFLNSDKYITDSDYYQEFSYEIQVEKSLDKYIDIIKKLTHPVGNKMFGKPLIIDTNKFDQNILVEATTTYNARGVIISSSG
jgi:hypothetical protein